MNLKYHIKIIDLKSIFIFLYFFYPSTFLSTFFFFLLTFFLKFFRYQTLSMTLLNNISFKLKGQECNSKCDSPSKIYTVQLALNNIFSISIFTRRLVIKLPKSCNAKKFKEQNKQNFKLYL